MNRKEIEEWLIKYEIPNYTIHDNLMVDVHQSVWLHKKNLAFLPFEFGIVQGNFNCSGNDLTSLEHCPKEVQSDFYCEANKLTSLEHCPKVICGHFVFDMYLRNDIRALRHHLSKQLQSL